MALDHGFFAFATATAGILLTPGPTNTLLAAAGIARGARRALPLVGVELAGYLAAITAWGVFLASAQQRFPSLGMAVRVASSAYLAYVAVKIWCSAREHSTAPRAIGHRALFMATLLNPKALVFASAVFPPHAFEQASRYAAAMAVFAGLALPIGVLWTRFGAALSSGRLAFTNPFKLQRAAALAIGMFSVSLAWTVVH